MFDDAFVARRAIQNVVVATRAAHGAAPSRVALIVVRQDDRIEVIPPAKRINVTVLVWFITVLTLLY